MSSKQGGGTLQSQIARLESILNAIQIEQATKLAHEHPDIVRLAFKKIPKSQKKGLSKKAMETYEQIRKHNENAADKWLADRLAEKG